MAHLGFTKKTELSEWLGCKKQDLNNWEKRGRIGDYSLFTGKGISEIWLRTGKGGMLHPHVHFAAVARTMVANNMDIKSEREGPALCDEQRRLLDAWNEADPVSRKNALMILETSAKESREKGAGGSNCAGQNSA